VGQAVGVANESPAAHRYATQIIGAANDSFVGGLHLIGAVAAAVTLVAALCVALYLPARARDDDRTGDVAQKWDTEPEPVAQGAVG
jgi:hypothetical protein